MLGVAIVALERQLREASTSVSRRVLGALLGGAVASVVDIPLVWPLTRSLPPDSIAFVHGGGPAGF